MKQNDTDYVCVNKHSFWNNPKAAATTIIIKDSEVLVAKRGIEPFKGKYDFPGGFLNYGERAEDAAKREMQEEVGIKIDGLKLIESYTHEYVENTSVSDYIFVTKTWSGEMKAKDDVEELSWQPVSFIDSDDFAWKYPGLTAKLNDIL